MVIVPTWVLSGQLSPERLGSSKGECRGVLNWASVQWVDDRGVADQPRGQLEAHVAQVVGREGDAGLAGGCGPSVKLTVALSR